MIYPYTPSSLEEWVTKFYLRLRIFTPEDLDETHIARALRIHLLYKPISSCAFQHGNFKAITIDATQGRATQREHFYHELCHILRHAGQQMMMPAAFRELQENDAHNFTRYAAVPFHMLHLFNIHDPNLIQGMSDRLNITPQLCEERLIRLKNKIQQSG